MLNQEFRLALTYALQVNKWGNQDIAILWDGEKLVQIQNAPKVDVGATTIALPIVRLLRAHGERLGKGFVISTTAPPTEACLGMARMCGIHYILYLSGEHIGKVTCQRSGTTLATSDTSFTGTIPNVTDKGKNLAWHKNPVLYKDQLKAWVDRFTPLDTKEARAVKVGKTLAPSNPPEVTSFASSGLEYVGLKAMIGDQTVVDNVLMMLAFEMVAQVSGFAKSDKGAVTADPGQRSAGYSGQNIGSLLSDTDGNIVSWGFNTNKENSTRHGEVNLIASYLGSNPGEPLPAGGAIYTTLEPCEMCSGMIARTVKSGDTFRVIYGQKDENVTSTALQRKVNVGITMEESKAALATAAMIKSGSATGATNKLVTAMTAEQNKSGIIATTQFLKTKSTYEQFFGAARPNWWLYLWDYLTSRLALPSRDQKAPLSTLLKDPAVVKLNNNLDTIYLLVEQFMKTVKSQSAPE